MSTAAQPKDDFMPMVPLYTRLYPSDRDMLDELVDSFPAIPRKKIRKDTPKTRKITDAEVVRIAIAELHMKRIVRVRNKKKKA